MRSRERANVKFAPLYGEGRRGIILPTTIMLLMVFSVVGLALASGSMQALHLSSIQEKQSAAFNLAESGADRGLLWLKAQSSPPSQITGFNPFGGPITLGNGTYTVTVDGDDANPGLDYKRYAIRSIGVVGNRQETVEMYVRQSNFGRFAYFTDAEMSSITGNAIFFKTTEVIDGPAHSNNSNNTLFNINWLNSTQPIFKSDVTAVGTSILYTPTNPASESDYQKIFGAGSRGYKLGVSRIELPDSSDRQKNAAWGSTTGFPATDGVYVNSASSIPLGGIYVKAALGSAIQFKDDGNDIQRIEITIGLTTTKVQVDRRQNKTVVFKGDGSASDNTKVTYAGLPNGVIYSPDSVTSLKGTLTDGYYSGSSLISRNAWTVATDIVNGKNITITDNLTYKTQPDKTQGWDAMVNQKAGTLGLVARNVIVDATALNTTINGVMLAGGHNTTDGSFYNLGYNTKSPGVLTLLGGIIQKARGPVGTFNSSTGAQSTGYQKSYSYDSRMAVNPPPYFPTTGTYDRLSWARTSAGGAY